MTVDGRFGNGRFAKIKVQGRMFWLNDTQYFNTEKSFI